MSFTTLTSYPDSPILVLTVDLEDWYHGLKISGSDSKRLVRRVTPCTFRLLDLFDRHNVKATFFVLGEVAREFPSLVVEVDRRGHEIGTHGSSHVRIEHLGEAQFRESIRISISELQDLTGKPVRSHRAPHFSMTSKTLWALDVLAEEGITRDSSILPTIIPGRGDPTLPRLPFRVNDTLIEWPMTTISTAFGNWPFSGGSYSRILPDAVVRRLTRHLLALGEPVMTYIHPYEVDLRPPSPPMRYCFTMPARFIRLSRGYDSLDIALKMGRYVSLKEAVELLKVEG